MAVSISDLKKALDALIEAIENGNAINDAQREAIEKARKALRDG